jgi:transposase
MDDQLRQAYRRCRTRTELSRELTRLCSSWGRPRYALTNRSKVLNIRLLTRKLWTKDELATLRELAGQVSIRAIAKKLHRSPHSVKHQMFRMGISGEVAQGYSIHQLEQLLGVKHTRIQTWLAKHWLSVRDQRITEGSVKNFLLHRMDAYSFRNCDEIWLKGMLSPTFGAGIEAAAAVN